MRCVSGAPVLLILGAGPRTGKSVASTFKASGYKVALAARSIHEKDSTPDQLNIQADLSDPTSIPSIYAKVTEALGLPSVIVYNGASRTVNDPKRPLAMSRSELHRDFAVNTFSVLEAAEQAILAFEQLPPTASRTFIFTGNFLNEVPLLPVIGFGMTKAATAHMIDAASRAYRDRGFNFYYADQRKEDGRPAYDDVSGDVSAEFYLNLADQKTQGPWQATHVQGLGYVHFDRRSDP